MFVGMGLSAVFPVLHGLSLYGASRLEETMGLSWVVLQGVLYVLGAGIYAVSDQSLTLHSWPSANEIQLRIPERWRPGQFDIWGSSHQIFHVLVVCAATAHLVGLLTAFDNRHQMISDVRSPPILQIPSFRPFGFAIG